MIQTSYIRKKGFLYELSYFGPITNICLAIFHENSVQCLKYYVDRIILYKMFYLSPLDIVSQHNTHSHVQSLNLINS